MTETLEPLALEQLPFGNEYYLQQIDGIYHDSHVPTLQELEGAQQWLTTMPRDTAGNILNTDGTPVPQELQDEVVEKISDEQWRLAEDDYQNKKIIANTPQETDLNDEQYEEFNTFHAAAESDGQPSDFNAFKRFSAAKVNLETEFRARDDERKSSANNANRPKPGKLGGVKTSSPRQTTIDASEALPNPVDNEEESKAVEPTEAQADSSVTKKSERPTKASRKEMKANTHKAIKRYIPETRAASVIKELAGPKTADLQKRLLIEELTDLGITPTEAILAKYLRTVRPEEAERNKNKATKIVGATGRLALKNTVKAGQYLKHTYVETREASKELKVIKKARQIGRTTINVIDPTAIVAWENREDTTDAILHAATMPAITHKQKRKVAARNEELRRVAEGTRTGEFVVDSNGDADYHSRPVK